MARDRHRPALARVRDHPLGRRAARLVRRGEALAGAQLSPLVARGRLAAAGLRARGERPPRRAHRDEVVAALEPPPAAPPRGRVALVAFDPGDAVAAIARRADESTGDVLCFLASTSEPLE